jgi:hypothetical protein
MVAAYRNWVKKKEKQVLDIVCTADTVTKKTRMTLNALAILRGKRVGFNARRLLATFFL